MIRLLKLEEFPLGVEDRFACQAKAQLRAFLIAAQQGGKIIPVWNKSNREHRMAGSEPSGTPAAAPRRREGTRLGEALPRSRKCHLQPLRATH